MRALGVAAMSLLAGIGCASSAFDYAGPSRRSPRPAQLRLLETEIERHDSTTGVALHVYELGDQCLGPETLEASYRGAVGLTPFPRSIEVRSGGYLFLQVKLRAYEGDVYRACNVSGGFVPEPGRTYVLRFSAYSSRTCVILVYDEAMQPVATWTPPECE
ncbi:MAG: hypothetical protein ACQGVC_06050 [Myxococcota bacterium]